jgi:AraC-like DNA-binding protein
MFLTVWEASSMNHDFFARFYPRIIDVFHRGREYWLRYNYELFRESTTSHNLLLVLHGEGVFESHGTTTMLSAGHIFHFCTGHRFRLTSSIENPLHYYALHFDYRMLKWEGNALQVSDSEGSLPFEPVMKFQDNSGVQSLFDHLYLIWSEKRNGYEWQSRMAFMELLREISRQHRLSGPANNEQSSKLIEASVDYIKKNFCRKLVREQLAENASLSISYFSILFKKETGYSPIQYINRLRIDHAKQLLRSTTSPISNIARDVGYEDPLYFAKVFAKETGMPPREYRKA